jgi:ABC-type tungstate transport system substrate-binding protein
VLEALSRIFWIGAAAILIAAALVALTAVVLGDSSEPGRILASLAAALLGGATLLSGLALVDRGVRSLGWTAVAVAVPGLALCVYAIWAFTFEGDDDVDNWGWTGAFALLAALVAATARLLARDEPVVGLAWLAGALAVAAATAFVTAIWRESTSDTFEKALTILWILTALAYFLVPVLQRFRSAVEPEAAERILGELDGVRLVATRAGDGFEPRLVPGERLVLRRAD